MTISYQSIVTSCSYYISLHMLNLELPACFIYVIYSHYCMGDENLELYSIPMQIRWRLYSGDRNRPPVVSSISFSTSDSPELAVLHLRLPGLYQK